MDDVRYNNDSLERHGHLFNSGIIDIRETKDFLIGLFHKMELKLGTITEAMNLMLINTDPQLVKVQRIREYGVLSLTCDMSVTLLHPRTQ